MKTKLAFIALPLLAVSVFVGARVAFGQSPAQRATIQKQKSDWILAANKERQDALGNTKNTKAYVEDCTRRIMGQDVDRLVAIAQGADELSDARPNVNSDLMLLQTLQNQRLIEQNDTIIKLLQKNAAAKK